MRWLIIILLFFISFLTFAQKKFLFSSISPNQTGVLFKNEVLETPSRNIGVYDYMYNGAGVAIGDLNNDGLPDIFFCGNDTPNKLYQNLGNFKFEDVSEKAGIVTDKWATGVTLVDINTDGWLDIYVCYSGPDYAKKSTGNELYINQQDGTFKEQAKTWGVADNALSSHAVFFDFDRDGFLDLFVLNHAIRNWANETEKWFKQLEKIPESELKRYANTFYRNNGDGTFTDISVESGLFEVGFGLGVSISDFDGNGYLDIYVSNDYFIPNRLYLNQGNGTFKESLSKKFGHIPFFSMGCDAADFNNDGRTDLAVLDMTPSDHYRNKVLMTSMNTSEFDFLTKAKGYVPQYMFNSLFVNNGNGVMSDIAHLSGVASTDWSWSPLLADFNNDSKKDLYVTNGFLRDVNNNDWRMELLKMIQGQQLTKDTYFEHLQSAKSQPVLNEMYQNKNGYEFKLVNTDWGLTEVSFSTGAAYGDLDQDGDLDLVVNNTNSPAFILKNNTTELREANFIRFRLEDKQEKAREVGAKVCVYYKNQLQCAENFFTRGYQSNMEPILHFGLQSESTIDSAVVYWNKDYRQVIINPAINKTHLVVLKEGQNHIVESHPRDLLFWDIGELAILPAAVHQENSFNDFEKEVLLPHKMSQLGPALAVADINGDGLDDFYLGGAKNQPGKLYVQGKNGFFNPSETESFVNQRNKEEVGATFIDFNLDGFPDLYIACAGNGLEENDEVLQDLLYQNDGKGNFTITSNLPPMYSSTKTILPFDWDSDGDLDLFVAGRVESGKYPTAPQSFLLENVNGSFVDVTSKIATDIQQLGMISDALFMKDSDSQKIQLLIVGEWMTLECFEWVSGKFTPCSDFTAVSGSGWWNCIEMADLNGDGKKDILLGNVGKNNKFHPKKEAPLFLFANDMDENGTLDIVLSKNYNGELVPTRGKECSSQQMPFLKDKFNSYHDFASSALIEIYDEQKIEESIHLKADEFASVWLENTGYDWIKHELPIEAQVSAIHGFIVKDFDNDGVVDILLAGNNFSTEVETTPYDSGKGLFLKGIGNGEFLSVDTDQSGVFLAGDVRDIMPINISSEKIYGVIVANNNGAVKLLMQNENWNLKTK